MQQPVQVVMQPLQPPSSSQQPASVPLRWAEAIRNVDSAQRTLEDLARQLDSALYLDEEAWRQAVPHAQFSAALQGQQRKIAELEQQLASVVARLEASEAARQTAEARVAELSSEVENHGSVFKLHYEELLRKDQEIHDLQAVIQALSLGGSSGGGGGERGAGREGRGVSIGGGGSTDSGTPRSSTPRSSSGSDVGGP